MQKKGETRDDSARALTVKYVPRYVLYSLAPIKSIFVDVPKNQSRKMTKQPIMPIT
jgi:hypothetical protein